MSREPGQHQQLRCSRVQLPAQSMYSGATSTNNQTSARFPGWGQSVFTSTPHMVHIVLLVARSDAVNNIWTCQSDRSMHLFYRQLRRGEAVIDRVGSDF